MSAPGFDLRPPRGDDILPYSKLLADSEVSVWLEDYCQRPVSPFRIEKFFAEGGWARWAIEHDGAFVGLTGLEDPDLERGIARFFIVLGERRLWGQGLGTMVARQVLKAGFDRFGLRKIVSDYLEPNLGSAQVHERVGFTIEGRLRQDAFRRGCWVDRILLSILRDEFSANEKVQ